MIRRLPDNDPRAIERLLLMLGFFSCPGPGTLGDLLQTAHPGGEGGYQLPCSPAVDVGTLKNFNYAAPWPRDDYDPVDDMVRIMRDHLAQMPGAVLSRKRVRVTARELNCACGTGPRHRGTSK